MNNTLINECKEIIIASIDGVKPDAAVKKALLNKEFSDCKLVLVSIGKAAYSMAQAAYDILGDAISNGIVITKYKHAKGSIGNLIIREAGHPTLDDNSVKSAKEALELTGNLCERDTVLFLVSGGGSALFEDPKISLSEFQDINKQLLESGADIKEINTVRKRLSNVKGGRFALHCAPANIFQIVLSDIIGDPLDMIASGPAYPDSTTCKQALEIVDRYQLKCSDNVISCLSEETPKEIGNVETVITGSVRELCKEVEKELKRHGYDVIFLTDRLSIEARDAGSFVGSIIKSNYETDRSIAFVAGGETVVHVKGDGLGGRNQELALSAAKEIAGLKDVVVFSVGSDGSDGPCDAAGGIVSGETVSMLESKGINIDTILNNNDAYHALSAVDGLIMTGPTGTNVNDVSVALIKK